MSPAFLLDSLLPMGFLRALAVLSSALLVAGCSKNEGPPKLTWYINPDPAQYDDDGNPIGQTRLAERCSTERYTIEVEVLPTNATQQRVQLMRRLAARDSSIDLMSLDPVFTAELAEARFLHPIPVKQAEKLSAGVLDGARKGALYGDAPVVIPLWANTQVLWYRKSVAAKAGLDMSQPVTWDQIIEAAEATGTTVGVQANKYEGLVVWINALIESAGGSIVADSDITIDSEAGAKAARVVSRLANSEAAAPQFSVSNEGTSADAFGRRDGGFLVNWTFIYSYGYPQDVMADLGWARYPRTVATTPSAPPVGGINIGIGAFSKHPELALEAVACITTEESQVIYALDTGNMPAREAAYQHPDLGARYPQDLLTLYRTSIDEAGPRPASPYWNNIVGAVLHHWHPGRSVDPKSTPAESAAFISEVLSGNALL